MGVPGSGDRETPEMEENVGDTHDCPRRRGKEIWGHTCLVLADKYYWCP